jgi:nucleotide-binding universal stress UspA family protein
MAAMDMQNVNTILAALDLEAGSNAVLTRAIQLATAHGARLILLHVIEAEPLSQAASVSGRSENELRHQLKRQALATIEPLLIKNGRTRRTDVQVEFGSPHDIVTHVAKERHADVIVVGPGKGRSIRERFLGSTADRVIRTAHASVLVVRKGVREPYRRVVIAVDFSSQSATAVKEARRLAPEADLQVVHAVDIPLAFQQAMLHGGTPQIEIQKYRSARIAKARGDLSSFGRAIVGANKVITRVLEGRPASVLGRLSRAHRVDLLALGPHGRARVRQVLLGSVTMRVLNAATCDVLIAIKPD